MNCRVSRIGELLEKIGIGHLISQLPSTIDGTFHPFTARGELQFSAVGPQHGAPFLTHGVGHDQDQAVTPCSRDHRQGNTGITAGGLHQHGALRRDASSCFCIADHGHPDAVLDRGGRIETLELGDNLRPTALVMGEAVEPHQWGVTHECGDVRGNRHRATARQLIDSFWPVRPAMNASNY